MIEKKSIMTLLNEIADMMEYKGENTFKVAAYRNGANAIRRCEDDLDKLIKEKSLDKLKGIGKGLQSVIYEYCDTGVSSLYNELRSDVPGGIEQLLKIKGLSPKKIKVLYEELGISTIGELEYACKENRLALLKGFGAATQEKILKEIDNLRKYSRLVLFSTGLSFADEISAKLDKIPSILQKSNTGELRRGMEIIAHIELVVQVSSEEDFLNDLSSQFKYQKEEKKIQILEYTAVPITLYVTDSPEEFVRVLFITTGSEPFLNEIKAEVNKLRGNSEKDFFKALKFPYVIPEMREHEYFSYKKKENTALDINQFKGMLHFHSTWSDGRNSLADMIKAAEKKGYRYAAVCDHSRAAFYANGLTEDRIILQNKELRQLANQVNIKLIQGIESDILQDGSLDYSTEFLGSFGFIVASIHSRFKMDETAMTERMLKAIENPYTDLLAHPSGRLLLSRDPYGFNVKKIIDACSANNVAIEINSNPRRLDIDWRHLDYAREKGCLFSINPDAHSIDEIDLVKYGVIMGRKGGLQPEEVINCFSPEEFYKFVNRKVNRSSIW
jgi:DNA polymerase (family X)